MSDVIAHGRRSDVFESEDNTVIKLYSADFPVDKIHTEFVNSKLVWQLGSLDTARPIEEVTLKGRSGIRLSQVEGRSLMDIFQSKPWLYISYIPKLAGIHKSIHSQRLDLRTQSQTFTELLEQTDRLAESERELVLEILHRPHTSVLCHGDFHHGNIILDSSGKFWVIDWMDAFSGDYRLDLALTCVNAVVSTAPPSVPVILRIGYDIFKRITSLDERYRKAYGVTDMSDFLLLAAAIHLSRYDGQNIQAHQQYFQRLLSTRTNR